MQVQSLILHIPMQVQSLSPRILAGAWSLLRCSRQLAALFWLEKFLVLNSYIIFKKERANKKGVN